ncbi:hypothetical protein AB0L40_07880 [Patulibacter sp. NPDC049589]|uniref:hypothetical protein n=1 Tax=Patulibacter sp. NPDC049589 TaxID=3154731 RepID=UPI00343C036C
MTNRPGRENAREERLRHHGEAVAVALVTGDAGDAEGGTGWQGGLQAAADAARNESALLRIADEVYAAASGLHDPDRVTAFATAALEGSDGPLAVAFLTGMLEGTSEDPELDGVH